MIRIKEKNIFLRKGLLSVLFSFCWLGQESVYVPEYVALHAKTWCYPGHSHRWKCLEHIQFGMSWKDFDQRPIPSQFPPGVYACQPVCKVNQSSVTTHTPQLKQKTRTQTVQVKPQQSRTASALSQTTCKMHFCSCWIVMGDPPSIGSFQEE